MKKSYSGLMIWFKRFSSSCFELLKFGGLRFLILVVLLQGDLGYLWKLLAGSILGAVLVKYGSILVPEITRPNITQALLMICLPVVVSVLLLINASSSDS